VPCCASACSISGKIGQRGARERRKHLRAKAADWKRLCTRSCTSQLPAADVHEDKMRVAWGRSPFAARRAIALLRWRIRSLTLGVLPAPWVDIVALFGLPAAIIIDSRRLMQLSYCTFSPQRARTEGRLMWRLVLPGERGCRFLRRQRRSTDCTRDHD
jgi:hypothetical protein